MKLKQILRYHLHNINEGIMEEGTPDMKYYAFDWDDNLVHMPTQILLLNSDGEETPMSTSDFAKYRTMIGQEEFNYNGQTIVGFARDPFKYFREAGDNQFIIDSEIAEPVWEGGWKDFVEAINGGSIFSIITARGHNPDTIKEAVYNMIISQKNGINLEELLRNLEVYRKISGEESRASSVKDKVMEYLDMCKFYPVTHGSKGSAVNPEEAKVDKLDEFLRYVDDVSEKLKKPAYFINLISNNFNIVPPRDMKPKIGFSDDDERNLSAIAKNLGDKENLQLYTTKGGIKKKFND
jgi:hypothetical protein